jgi:hypothetical protein
MADTEERITFDTTEPCLGSFLNVTEAKRITQSANEVARFSANFELLNESEDLKRLRGLIVQVARAKWPSLDVGAAIRAHQLQVPIQDGTELADRNKADHAAGKKNKAGKVIQEREWSRGRAIFIARSKDEYPPELTVRENGKPVSLEHPDAIKAAGRKHFYTGQNVMFGVRLKAYDGVGATGLPGVNAYLEAVESVGGGEKLIGNRADPTSRFSSYQGIESEEDPTQGEFAPRTSASDENW